MNETILTESSVSKKVVITTQIIFQIFEFSFYKKDYLNPNVRSYEESLIYTKRLIVVAISNIVYLRSVFPEEVFATKEFENLKIKIIKSKDKDSHTLVNWLKGAFDAITKKYVNLFSKKCYQKISVITILIFLI